MEAPIFSPADVAEFRRLPGFVWLDTYEVIRETESGRDARGATVTTMTTVEVGRCFLRPVGNQPNEAVVAGRIQVTEPNAVDLPWDTTLTAADDIVVNGTAYEVHGVSKGGNLSPFATAVVSKGTS